MKKGLVVPIAFLVLTLACIHVVVNVYFPESEAKGALASLEDELLKGIPADKSTPPQPPPPQSRGLLPSLLLPEAAHAAGPVTEEELKAQIKGMPEVQEAYERIGGRMARVDALRDSGMVGEGSDGLLKPRGDLSDRRDQRTLEEENADRKVVIRGLAKAALKAQGLAVNDENLQQVMDSAASTFASLRRERARAGWWIQAPDGTWKKK